MRGLLAVLLVLALAHPARADEPAAAPASASAAPASAAASASAHPATWYAGWALITGGAAAQLTGVGLTTQGNTDAGQPAPGLSPAGTAGWTLVGVGAALWIGGAVLLELTSRRTR